MKQQEQRDKIIDLIINHASVERHEFSESYIASQRVADLFKDSLDLMLFLMDVEAIVEKEMDRDDVDPDASILEFLQYALS